MNEIELLTTKIEALLEADERLVELERNGGMTLAEREAWLRVNGARRDAYSNRLDKLIETRGGTTPVLTRQQADVLRDAVSRLQVQNISEAAVRALLDEALSIAEMLTAAAPKGLDSAKAAPPSMIAGRSYLGGIAGFSFVAAIAVVVLIARRPVRRGGRSS